MNQNVKGNLYIFTTFGSFSLDKQYIDSNDRID